MSKGYLGTKEVSGGLMRDNSRYEGTLPNPSHLAASLRDMGAAELPCLVASIYRLAP